MRKVIGALFMVLLVMQLTAQPVDDRTEYPLSYHGPSLTYYWNVPSAYGDTEYGVMYTPAADCDLLRWEILLYQVIGSPTGITVNVYDEAEAGGPGALLGSLIVPVANITPSHLNYNIIDLTGMNLSFTAGQNFFITYSVNGGSTANVIRWLSDDGTFATVNHTWERGSTGAWITMAASWGNPYEMFAQAIVDYAGELQPVLSTNYTSMDFGLTALGGFKVNTMILTNSGGGELIISDIAVTGANFAAYNDYTLPDTLGPNESLTFRTRFEPTEVGPASGNIAITDNLSRNVTDIPLSGEGYIHQSWASENAIFDQPPMGNQGDYGWSMGTSDVEPGYLLMEDYWGIVEPIGAIEFWGINWYHNGTSWVQDESEDPMDFNIAFWSLDENTWMPDAEVATYTLSLTRTEVDSVTFSSGPVYRYRAELPTPVYLGQGWVKIQGATVGDPSPWFLWSESPIGDYANLTWDDTNSEWDVDDVDCAMALFGLTTPSAPINVNVAMDGPNATITWVPLANHNYRVYVSNSPDSGFELLGTSTDGTGIYQHFGAGTAQKLFYRVTADNEAVGGATRSSSQKPMISATIKSIKHKAGIENMHQ